MWSRTKLCQTCPSKAKWGHMLLQVFSCDMMWRNTEKNLLEHAEIPHEIRVLGKNLMYACVKECGHVLSSRWYHPHWQCCACVCMYVCMHTAQTCVHGTYWHVALSLFTPPPLTYFWVYKLKGNKFPLEMVPLNVWRL